MFDELSAAEQLLVDLAENDIIAHGDTLPDVDAAADLEHALSDAEQRRPTLEDMCKSVAENAVEDPRSKKERALEMFSSKHSRKVNIQLFIRELEMSASGAATYYQKIKSGKWS